MKIKVSEKRKQRVHQTPSLIGHCFNISDFKYRLLRRWKQIQDATVTTKGLVRAADCGKAGEEEAGEGHQQLVRLADTRIQQHSQANARTAQQNETAE